MPTEGKILSLEEIPQKIKNEFFKNDEWRFVMSWKWMSLAGSHIFTEWENISKQSHFLL